MAVPRREPVVPFSNASHDDGVLRRTGYFEQLRVIFSHAAVPHINKVPGSAPVHFRHEEWTRVDNIYHVN